MEPESRKGISRARSVALSSERDRLVAIFAGYSAAVVGFIGMMALLVVR